MNILTFKVNTSALFRKFKTEIYTYTHVIIKLKSDISS